MKTKSLRRSGFTLIELLAVIVIIAVIATISTPGLQRAIEKSRSVACAGNLRSIGTAVQLYLGDHENNFPIIEPYPSQPVYPADQGAAGMLAVLGPYGVEAKTLQCPTDAHEDNNFTKEGTSYMWNPTADGENLTAIMIYGRNNRAHLLKSLSRLSLCSDFTSESGVGPHSGKINTLYADGHVLIK